MKVFNALIILFATVFLAGCATQSVQQKNSPYTQGNVTLTLKKGVTTQADVVKVFGAPNIVTQDSSGNQVWIYQKNNVTISSDSSGGYFTILVAGISSAKSSYQQSSQTMTLTIYFNKKGVVSDFKSMSTNF